MGKNITEILWTSTAKKDLKEIFEYLVQFSEDAAFRIINKIVDKAEIRRGDSPEIG